LPRARRHQNPAPSVGREHWRKKCKASDEVKAAFQAGLKKRKGVEQPTQSPAKGKAKKRLREELNDVVDKLTEILLGRIRTHSMIRRCT
jgi:hypothetical protein